MSSYTTTPARRTEFLAQLKIIIYIEKKNEYNKM